AQAAAQPAEESPDWLKGIEETPPTVQPAVPAEASTAGWEALGSLGTSAKEQDEALAWLESLAARHGAKPEELVTPPEARQEKPPEWVEAARQRLEETPAVPTVPAEPAEELPDWLKSMAEETPSAAQAAAQPAEESPDWLKGMAEETPPAAQAEAPVQPTEELPEWLKGIEETPVTGQVSAQPAEELPEWLKDIEETPSAVRAEEPVQPAEELPEWLKGMAEERPAVATSQPADELPDWLKTVTTESEMDETGAWLRALESPQPSARPEAPAPEPEMMIEEETPPVTPPPALDWKPVEVEVEPPSPSITVPPHPKRTGSLSPTRDVHLAQAQQALERGDIRQAVEHYSRLIRKGRLLDEVIFDLREALYRYPVDVLLWQTLGDAYMRANRLREALDAYTKAEQLLR
ncbi:MAG: hypothetical protein WHS87_03360, partial [Anaerolineales bacterium]